MRNPSSVTEPQVSANLREVPGARSPRATTRTRGGMPMEGSVHALGGLARGPGNDVGGVVEDHPPFAVQLLEEVGGEDGGDRDVALLLAQKVLRQDHPGEGPRHLDPGAG